MTYDLVDHPFSAENIAYESGAPSKSEALWFSWAAECERLLGHDLDGNDVAYGDTPAEGYSLDEAFDCFERGQSAYGYARMVGARARYNGRAAGRVMP